METSPQLQHLVRKMAEQDPTRLPTPAACTAGKCSVSYDDGQGAGWSLVENSVYLQWSSRDDFCLIPLGTPTASVSKEVAEVQRLLKRSGLKYSMHSAGTTLEGSWDDCMRVIGQCHAMLHANGIVRIQSDIRVGSRTDKLQGFEDKVKAVEKLLAEDDR